MLTYSRAKTLLETFDQKKILVIGDVMLDYFVYGSVSRYSPEYPTCPILNYTHEEYMLGGAANVASNLKALGAGEVSLLGAVGRDPHGDLLHTLLCNKNIGTFLHKIEDQATITKTRFIYNNKHLLRLDVECPLGLVDFAQQELVAFSHVDGVILQDYAKGVFTDDTLRVVLDFFRDRDIPIFVDPKKDHWHKYNDVALIKPNLKEAQTALGKANENSLSTLARGIRDITGARRAVITAGSKGMYLTSSAGDAWVIPSPLEVVDVSGAGDTAIAILALSFLSGASSAEALSLANMGAGVAIGKKGTAVVTAEEILTKYSGV